MYVFEYYSRIFIIISIGMLQLSNVRLPSVPDYPIDTRVNLEVFIRDTSAKSYWRSRVDRSKQ